MIRIRKTIDFVPKIIPNADGHRVLTFTDWRGRTVLVRKVLADNKYIDTHTLYNAWGDVLLVLQPEGVAAMQSGGSWDVSDGSMDDLVEKYAYVYRYDDALRPVYAKLPGCDPVTTAYDPDGLAAYTVDGNLRAKGKARFTLYDSAARPVVTGICDEPSGEVPRMRAAFGMADPGLDSTYYATEVPLTGAEVHTATYYNNYDFRCHRYFDKLPADLRARATDARGLATGTLERVLATGPVRFLASMTLYDKEERPTLVMQTTHTPGVVMTTENEYNIDGSVASCDNKLLHPSGNHSDSHTYAYDSAGRLVGETVSYDGGDPVSVQQLSYNAVGQLAANDLGAFTEAYTYNVRGAMTKRKSDVFEQDIFFRCRNGSISSISDKLTDGLTMTGQYTYDKAGRLTQAYMKVGGAPRYVDYTYDLNSNITSLVRDGDDGIDPIAWIDNLTYTYDGNKVRKITDLTGDVISERTMDFPDKADLDTEYSYDRNGNMTRDANKGLKMRWDANNRLVCVEDGNGYFFHLDRSATGRLLDRENPIYRHHLHPGDLLRPIRAIIKPGGGIPIESLGFEDFKYHYYGPYEYKGGEFSRLNTPTGYRDSLGMHVYVRDWQGNTRAVVRKGAYGKTILEQATYYYPYGMPMAESTNPTINKYKYTGKELLTDHGVNIMDYGARFYDPVTGIWLSPDPHSADYAPMSHYSMCASDPINFVDITGLDPFSITFSLGARLGVEIGKFNANLDFGSINYISNANSSESYISTGFGIGYGLFSITQDNRQYESSTTTNIETSQGSFTVESKKEEATKHFSVSVGIPNVIEGSINQKETFTLNSKNEIVKNDQKYFDYDVLGMDLTPQSPTADTHGKTTIGISCGVGVSVDIDFGELIDMVSEWFR